MLLACINFITIKPNHQTFRQRFNAFPTEEVPLKNDATIYWDDHLIPFSGFFNCPMKTAHQISNKRHQTFYGANARFVTSMKDMDENYFVLLGGQDGWLESANLIDQVPLWLNGNYIQIPLRLEKIKSQFTYRMEIGK